MSRWAYWLAFAWLIATVLLYGIQLLHLARGG
jgi:hypothetical protein